MMHISFQNSGGELSSETVETPCDVREALIKMIQEMDEFFDGDKFVITSDD